MVEELFEGVGVKGLGAQEVEEDAGVEIAAAGAHRIAAGGVRPMEVSMDWPSGRR